MSTTFVPMCPVCRHAMMGLFSVNDVHQATGTNLVKMAGRKVNVCSHCGKRVVFSEENRWMPLEAPTPGPVAGARTLQRR